MDFILENKSTVKVPMMHQSAKYRYTKLKEIGATALQMPYKGETMDMVFVLPDEGKELATVEKKIFDVDLNEKFGETNPRKVKVWLPKYKMAVTLDLNGPLSKMGVGDMFGDKADFSGVSKTKGLQVSQVLQKCIIKVDEEGSEAAAATAIGMMMRSAP